MEEEIKGGRCLENTEERRVWCRFGTRWGFDPFQMATEIKLGAVLIRLENRNEHSRARSRAEFPQMSWFLFYSFDILKVDVGFFFKLQSRQTKVCLLLPKLNKTFTTLVAH